MQSTRHRRPFSIIEELQHRGGLGGERERTAGPSLAGSAYQTLSFEEAVRRIQGELRQVQGDDSERGAQQELLHRAVIGDLKAQEKVKALISQWLLQNRVRITHGIQGMSEVDSLFAEAQGLSVIEDLYKSKLYEEIEVVGTRVFCMSKGLKQEISYRQFRSLRHVEEIQQRLVLYGHARISEREPYCHTFMYDGSRLTMKMPPFSAVPTITIRRFIVEDVSLHAMIGLQTLDNRLQRFLELLIQGKVNGIIAGDTGTGKTTLLHAMIDSFPSHERIVTLESEFELRIHEKYPRRNIIALQELPDLNLTMSLAFPTILRETPDRIIVGEVRSKEIIDALKACSRGHRGTWFTLHLSDPRQIHFVLYSLYIEAGLSIPFEAFAIQLGLSIQTLIYMKYNEIGQRIIHGVYHIKLDASKGLEIAPLVLYENGRWLWQVKKLPEDLVNWLCTIPAVKVEHIRRFEAEL